MTSSFISNPATSLATLSSESAKEDEQTEEESKKEKEENESQSKKESEPKDEDIAEEGDKEEENNNNEETGSTQESEGSREETEEDEKEENKQTDEDDNASSEVEGEGEEKDDNEKLGIKDNIDRKKQEQKSALQPLQESAKVKDKVEAEQENEAEKIEEKELTDTKEHYEPEEEISVKESPKVSEANNQPESSNQSLNNDHKEESSISEDKQIEESKSSISLDTIQSENSNLTREEAVEGDSTPKNKNNDNKRSKNISLTENIDIRRPENTLNLHHNDIISTTLNVSDTILTENSNIESVSCDPTLDACSNNNNTETTTGEDYLTGECKDNIDNDGDGLTDVGADPDCEHPPPSDTDSDGIGDSIDNCDDVPNPGQEDADFDGIGDACDGTPNPFELCENGIDDDGDGQVDLDDSECIDQEPCPRCSPGGGLETPETPETPPVDGGGENSNNNNDNNNGNDESPQSDNNNDIRDTSDNSGEARDGSSFIPAEAAEATDEIVDDDDSFLDSSDAESNEGEETESSDTKTDEGEEVGRITAEDVYKLQSIQLDSDVKNLVILIPNGAHYADPSQMLINQRYLPAFAKIVIGTNIIWINQDARTPHSLVIKDEETGKEIFTKASIPHRSSTSFTFTKPGAYSYSDPKYPLMKGSISVIDKEDSDYMDISSTSSKTPTIGFLVGQYDRKQYYEEQFAIGDYTVLSSHIFDKNVGNANKKSIFYIVATDSSKIQFVVK